MHVESTSPDLEIGTSGIWVRMLGPLTVERNGGKLELPASRKMRALFAYLALAPHAVGRSRLCELFWDVPNDPRGELRWCLSKLRSILDEPGRRRIEASNDMVALDLGDCLVDVLEIASATKEGIPNLDANRLRALSELFVGDFLEGLEIDRSYQFNNWLIAQRRRFRACHTAVLERLVGCLSTDSDEIFPLLEKWSQLAPFDGQAHVRLLAALAARGKIGECEEHLAATARMFEAENLDLDPVRKAWADIRNRRPAALRAADATPRALVLPDDIAGAPRRASLAVMPFLDELNKDGRSRTLSEGLTHDIITRLAKLRNLFVIARGSVFALAEQSVGPEDAGRRLNVDYVASGTVQHRTDRITVTVELVEARTARIVWTEAFDHKPDDAFLVLDEIGNRIVSSIASEIETVERNRAILKPPNSLDAWEAYHRGLWHMYRFTKPDNELAQHFFQMSVRLDPTFARAHAGLSFTHWQNAFQHWADRERESDRAFEAAGLSLIVDDHDPAAHWAMGRALWLRDRQDESIGELERAVDLSPNFALGHYALAFVHSQSGDPQTAIGSSDHSRHLSPFDPLLFGMLGARAMAHIRLGQFDEAAEWALKAAARPNAHAIILAIAAHCLALAGRVDEGRAFAATIRNTLPHYRIDDFLATFRFTEDAAALFRQGAKRIGLD
ncbi:BTAD domain-containing putative transcriptional regulator [Nitratireductor luteus]|uniref:BTAD domain-containing putative transcriptional regulator n=1 Tax=Nitratireductor luteus TaxID=2976980 RepID=UPI00223F6DBB|nr:BTAD domain-containing putative transcriptional regulator [Nitratireductor luteus]